MNAPLPSCPDTIEGIEQSDADVKAVIDVYDLAMNAHFLRGREGMPDRHRIGAAWHRYRSLHPQADRITEERD